MPRPPTPPPGCERRPATTRREARRRRSPGTRATGAAAAAAVVGALAVALVPPAPRPGRVRLWEAVPSRIDALEGSAAAADAVKVGIDTRRALTLQGPGRWRFPVPAARAAALRFSWAVLSASGPVRLSWRRGDGREVYSAAAVAGAGWQPGRVDLGTLTRESALELRLEGPPTSVALASPALTAPAAAPHPNVIVYLVDCLRADHVGAYGYPRPTTPAIDRLARDGVLFERAFSCAGWTKPAVACLFTGLYPPSHGAQTVEDALRPDLPTLAESFRRAGYATAAWSANPMVSEQTFGLARGFDRVVGLAQMPRGSNPNDIEADAAEITRPALEWLARQGERRFFLYLHSLDLHASYRRRPPFGRIFLSPERRGDARLVDLYDNELAYNDREIARLVAGLRRLGLYDDTLIVLVADHGEEFGGHGTFRHGRSLYEALLHVPLIVKRPGGRGGGRRVDRLASLVDLAPTILDLAGLPPLPHGTHGLSLAAAVEGRDDGREAPRALFAEQWPMYAVRGERYKLVEDPLLLRSALLFDLQRDPGERRDLLPERSRLAGQMRASVAELVAASLAGLHVAFVPDGTGGRIAVVATAQGGFEGLRRPQRRSSDAISWSADGARVEVAFDGDERRHLILRPALPDAEVRLRVTRNGRDLPVDRVRLGPSGGSPNGWPARLLPAELRVTADTLLDRLAEAGAGLHVLDVSGRAPARARIGPELERKLRALGYIE